MIAMSALPEKRYTLQEYLALERAAARKSEFYRGEIFAMVGGSPRHNDIAGNLYHTLRKLLQGRNCRPYNSDQRIKVKRSSLDTYPDVSVVCGPLELDVVDDEAITNPRAIVEVLSKSTERYDRGKKFELYREIESLAAYVLVAQDEPHVEVFTRQPEKCWVLTEAKGLGESVDLPALGCRLAMADIYEHVSFDTADSS
jgi:Uma2 family endonuclease